MLRIDAHQHYWQIARGDYFWMGPHVAPIVRDVFPADLAPHLQAAGIARTVVVQAAATVAETEFMLDLADKDDSIAAVVGWVDLEADDVEATLRRLAARPKFRGIRPMLQDIDDTFDILKPKQLAALKLLPKLGLRFDALAQPRHLPVVAALADHMPDLPIVVDHAAKPFIAKGILEPWASDMAALAKRPSVVCKFSGLVTEAGPNWSIAGLKPYADHLLACFGPDRLMFGSDWPVCELAATYENWLAAARELLAGLSPVEQDAVFGGTAARFYGIS
ncbi:MULTISPECIES: amidohydrolase family protein [unclassified Mesorhizobium]|uniref:amidohydrolase family protein n=1 Tax=unclassified Mesorhizobium TaxID=325217 RepID=UPI00167575A9|nr:MULTISPECIES: amidohydrolase family protein [unclassified Mesorhizobium]